MMSPGSPIEDLLDTGVDSHVVKVLQLITQRAVLMRIVAAYKFDEARGLEGLHGQSVYRAEWEFARLGRIEQFAQDLGLPSSGLLVFAQVQMDYAKFAQKFWLDKWISAEKDPAQKQTLAKEIDRLIKEGGGSRTEMDSVRNMISQVDQEQYGAIKSAAPHVVRMADEQGGEALIRKMVEWMREMMEIKVGEALMSKKWSSGCGK